jgi:hypothetical protein
MRAAAPSTRRPHPVTKGIIWDFDATLARRAGG